MSVHMSVQRNQRRHQSRPTPGAVRQAELENRSANAEEL
jgi:hypothetical protein